MTKYMIALCVFLAVCVSLALWRVNYLTKQNTQLETEKNGLTMELKRRNENVLALSERNKELEQAVAIDKTGFDWSYNIVNNPVIERLREQCKSCPTKTH